MMTRSNAVEIHSDWGTFEWLVHDAFAIGARVGIVANSDGHKGRPGASWPGAATFGAYGGLTAIRAEQLSRDALFDALRARRTVATTGTRLDLDVYIDVFVVDEHGNQVNRAVPGDIIATDARTVNVQAWVSASALVLRVGTEDLHIHHPAPDAGRRIAVRLMGARYRGRGREVDWSCTVRLTGATVASCVPVALWNPDLPLQQLDDHTLALRAITTGNTVGFDAHLSHEDPDAKIHIETNHGELQLALATLGSRPCARISADSGWRSRSCACHRATRASIPPAQRPCRYKSAVIRPSG